MYEANPVLILIGRWWLWRVALLWRLKFCTVSVCVLCFSWTFNFIQWLFFYLYVIIIRSFRYFFRFFVGEHTNYQPNLSLFNQFVHHHHHNTRQFFINQLPLFTNPVKWRKQYFYYFIFMISQIAFILKWSLLCGTCKSAKRDTTRWSTTWIF